MARRPVVTAFDDAAVARAFDAFPPPVRDQLLALRELIFRTAASTEGVGALEETLKWGEPAYVTAESGSGSTIRLGWNKTQPARSAMYFNCRTTLVETFRTLFPDDFRYDGNRALVLDADAAIPEQAAKFCITAALTYHRNAAGKARRAVRRA